MYIDSCNPHNCSKDQDQNWLSNLPKVTMEKSPKKIGKLKIKLEDVKKIYFRSVVKSNY